MTKAEIITHSKDTMNKLVAKSDKFRNDLISTQREADFAGLNIPFASGLTDVERKEGMDLIRMRVSEGYTYDESMNRNVYKDGDIIRKNGENPYTPQEVLDNMISQGNFGRYLDTTPSPSGADRGITNSGTTVPPGIEVKKGNANALMEAAFDEK